MGRHGRVRSNGGHCQHLVGSLGLVTPEKSLGLKAFMAF
jgi:hypothetical protein